MSSAISNQSAQAAGLELLSLELPPKPVPLFRQPQKLFNDRFDYMELRSQGGSILGMNPIPYDGSSDYYQAPENVRFGRASVYAGLESARDGLYRGSSLYLWRGISPRHDVFLEFYSWDIYNQQSQDELGKPISLKGVRAGITF